MIDGADRAGAGAGYSAEPEPFLMREAGPPRRWPEKRAPVEEYEAEPPDYQEATSDYRETSESAAGRASSSVLLS